MRIDEYDKNMEEGKIVKEKNRTEECQKGI